MNSIPLPVTQSTYFCSSPVSVIRYRDDHRGPYYRLAYSPMRRISCYSAAKLVAFVNFSLREQAHRDRRYRFLLVSFVIAVVFHQAHTIAPAPFFNWSRISSGSSRMISAHVLTMPAIAGRSKSSVAHSDPILGGRACCGRGWWSASADRIVRRAGPDVQKRRQMG
jgi:hypothetical protein